MATREGVVLQRSIACGAPGFRSTSHALDLARDPTGVWGELGKGKDDERRELSANENDEPEDGKTGYVM